LKDYNASKVLVIAFICNHCPTSQLYETRIKQLAEDYKAKGVELVAVQPNNPDAVLLDEMGYTDVGDSIEEMRIRADYRHFNFPYLYDGDTQKVATAYGPSATPHLFIFDSDRRLRYQGRIDNNVREPLVTKHDARDAIDALLAGKPVLVEKTPSVGCSTKWIYKEAGRRKEMEEIEKKPVVLKPASTENFKTLRKNSTGKLLLVDFWATWCGPCRAEIPDLVELQKKYKDRLQILGLVVDDEDLDAIKKFAAKFGINYPVAFATNEMRLQYGGIPALPTSFVLDSEGRVVQKHEGLRDPVLYETEVRSLLGLPIGNVRVETFEDAGEIFLKNSDRATELPGVDLSKLTPEQKTVAFHKFNAESCTCGCGYTLAQCRIYDRDCKTSKAAVTKILAAVTAAPRAAPASSAPSEPASPVASPPPEKPPE